MSSDQFKQLILCCIKNSNTLVAYYHSIPGFLDKLDNLKKMHQKLHKESEDILLNPNYDLHAENKLCKGKEWVRDLCKEIRSVCKECCMEVVFTKPKTEEYKNRIFAYYKMSGKDVSELIYFNKAKTEEQEINDLEI